jgi:hypothetical protein
MVCTRFRYAPHRAAYLSRRSALWWFAVFSSLLGVFTGCLWGQEGETQGGNKERVRSLPSGDLVEPAANGVEPAANGVEPAANGEGVDESYTALIRVSMIRSSVHSTAMDCNSLRGRG